jgi:3-oxoadipate enol-lactonase
MGFRTRLVLLHPVGLGAAMWDLVPGLDGPDRELVAPDFRGHGDAARPAGPFSLDDLADDVADVLAALPPGPPTVLIGLSLGGMVAPLVADRLPERVDGLVLADTIPGAGDHMRRVVGDRADRCETGGMAAVLDETVERWFTAEFRRDHPDTVAAVSSWLCAADPLVHAWTWRAIGEFDGRPALARQSAPVLVVCGGADVSTPPVVARTIVRVAPSATYAEIPGAAHLAPIERPAEFAGLVGDFLATLPLRKVSHG